MQNEFLKNMTGDDEILFPKIEEMFTPEPPKIIIEPPDPDPKPPKKVLTRIVGALLWLLILLLIAFIVFFNVFFLVRVQGVSMHYTLHDGQHVLLFRSSNASRGDIIVYRSGEQNIIKRVIGVGGDQLLFAREQGGSTQVLIRNGDGRFELIDEYYLAHANQYFEVSPQFNLYTRSSIYTILNPHHVVPEQFIITVPQYTFLVLGDNRRNSTDSRNTGFVHQSNVLGRVSRVVTADSSLERFLLFIYGGRTETVEN